MKMQSISAMMVDNKDVFVESSIIRVTLKDGEKLVARFIMLDDTCRVLVVTQLLDSGDKKFKFRDIPIDLIASIKSYDEVAYDK